MTKRSPRVVLFGAAFAALVVSCRSPYESASPETEAQSNGEPIRMSRTERKVRNLAAPILRCDEEKIVSQQVNEHLFQLKGCGLAASMECYGGYGEKNCQVTDGPTQLDDPSGPSSGASNTQGH